MKRYDPFCSSCSNNSGEDGTACARPVGDPGGLLVLLGDYRDESERMQEAVRTRHLVKSCLWDRPVAVDWCIRCPRGAATTRQAIEACRQYFEATVRVVRPEHVVAYLYEADARFFFGRDTVTVLDTYYVDGVPVTWVPDMELARSARYSNALLGSVLANVRRGTYERAKQDKAELRVVRSAEDARACMESLRGKEVVFDLETFGRVGDKDFRVLMLGVASTDPDDPVVWAWPRDALLQNVVELWSLLGSCVLCGHNVAYDIKALRYGLGMVVPHERCGDDTMVLARLFCTEFPSLSLANLSRIVGIEGHKDEAAELRKKAEKRLKWYVDQVKSGGGAQSQGSLFDAAEDEEDWWTAARRVAAGTDVKTYTHGLIDQEVELRYCAADVWTTKHLLLWLRAALDTGSAGKATRMLLGSHLRAAPLAVAYMEYNGMLVDMHALHELRRELSVDVARRRQELQDLLGVSNVDSTKQVARALFGKPPHGLGLPLEKVTDKGAAKVDEKVLVALRDRHGVEVAGKLLEYREVAKVISTYLDGVEQYVTDDGRVHPSFRLVGTKSGRMSCTNPNLQTIPSRGRLAKQVKDLFVAPRGYMLVQCDYANLELRIAAALSGDPNLIAAFREGKDLHRETARAISKVLWGNDFETCGFGYTLDTAPNEEAREKLRAEQKRRRSVCKVVNFGCVSMDTEVLTKDGWMKYEDVQVGDYVLGRTGWVRVLEKVKYDDAPVVDWQGFRVTPNHRWWSWKRTRKGRVYEFTTLCTATTEHNFVLSQKWDCGGGVGWGPDITEVVGWIVTDGHCTSSTVRIFQSEKKNPLKVAHIDALLARVGATVVRDVRPSGIVEWRFVGPDRRLWERRARRVSESLVLRMSQEERLAFLRAGIMAEGHYSDTGRWRFTQRPGRIADAYRLAFFLDGFFVREYEVRGAGKYRDHVALRFALSKPHITGQRLRVEPAGREPVWCLRTEDETFVMRRGSRMALTGNTLYGQSAKALAEAMGVSVKDAEKAQRAVLGRYDKLRRWIVQQEKRAEQRLCTWTYFEGKEARRRWLPQIRERSGDRRKAFNTPIQGTGHEYCLASLVRVSRWIWESGIDARLVLQVHDSLVFEVHEDDVQEFVPEVTRLMTDWYVPNDVPIEVDAEVGLRWGSLVAWRPDRHLPKTA